MPILKYVKENLFQGSDGRGRDYLDKWVGIIEGVVGESPKTEGLYLLLTHSGLRSTFWDCGFRNFDRDPRKIFEKDKPIIKTNSIVRFSYFRF